MIIGEKQEKDEVIRLVVDKGRLDLDFATFSDPNEHWEIVSDTGGGRWLGKVIGNGLTLKPAFVMCGPEMLPVLAIHPVHGPLPASTHGIEIAWADDAPSLHAVREIRYSSRQIVAEMSERKRLLLWGRLLDCVLGAKDGDSGKRPTGSLLK
jgi:hypothetical protein